MPNKAPSDRSTETGSGKLHQPPTGQLTGSFLIFLASGLIVAFADSLFEMAVVWHVLTVTGSATIVGAIAAGIALPVTLSAPFAGVLADRWSRRKLMIFSRLTRGGVITVVFFLYWARILNPWHLLAVGVVDSFIQTVGGAAATAVVPNLVSQDRVLKANAWLQGGSQVAPIVAGAAGGLIIAIVGIAGVAGITSILFMASGLMLALLAEASFGGGHSDGSRLTPRVFFSEFTEGFRHIARTPSVWTMMLVAVVANLFLSGLIFVLMPFYVTEVLVGGAPLYGYLKGALIVGSLIGLVISGRIGDRLRVGTVVGIAISFIGAQFVILAITSNLWLSFFLWALVGASLPIINIPLFSTLQLSVPDGTRARVMTTFMALSGASTPASFVIIGVIADRMGTATTFLIGGMALLLLGMVTWLQRRKLDLQRSDPACA